MAWHGDSYKHSLCAKGLKTGRKTYSRHYIPKIPNQTTQNFRSGLRCPICGLSMSPDADVWYCQRCNENWDKAKIEMFKRQNDQPLRERNWIQSNLRKSKSIEEKEKWETKLANWNRAHPNLVASQQEIKLLKSKQPEIIEGHAVYR